MCGFSRKTAYLMAFLSFVATLFFIIAVATPNWLKSQESSIGLTTTGGLSQLCASVSNSGGSSKSCTNYAYGKCDPSPFYDYNDPTDTKYSTGPCSQFKSVQSLALLAVLLSGFGSLIVLVLLASSSMGSLIQVLGNLCILGAGVCGMIAFSTYAALAHNVIAHSGNSSGSGSGGGSVTTKYDYSFGLFIIAWIFSYAYFAIALVTGAAFGSQKISGST